MPNLQRDIFPGKNPNTATPQYPLPVIDQTAAQFTTTTFTAGTDFTVSAGVAGATLKIQLPFKPILGNFGQTGSKGNSSIVLGGSIATTLGTEVSFIADTNNQGGSVTTLSNGQYMVDYENAIIYCKRADNATTGTITYSYWLKGSTGSSTAVTSIIPGTGATNLGKAEDAPHTSGDVGVEMLAVRNDSNATLTNTNFDYSPISVDAAGDLQVDVLSIIPGTSATNLGKAEDAVHVSGDTGTAVLAVRKDTAVQLTSADGDYSVIETGPAGHVYTQEGFAAAAENNDYDNPPETGVIGIQDLPIPNDNYSGTKGQNNSFTTFNVAAVPAKLLRVSVINTTLFARYLQLHNTATTPSSSDTAQDKITVPPNSQVILTAKEFGYNGQPFSDGLALANSTTAAIYTAGTAGDLLVDYEYIS